MQQFANYSKRSCIQKRAHQLLFDRTISQQTHDMQFWGGWRIFAFSQNWCQTLRELCDLCRFVHRTVLPHLRRWVWPHMCLLCGKCVNLLHQYINAIHHTLFDARTHTHGKRAKLCLGRFTITASTLHFICNMHKFVLGTFLPCWVLNLIVWIWFMMTFSQKTIYIS